MAAKAKGRAGGEERLARGRQRKEAIFPAAGPRPGLPGGYAQVLGEIKRRIQTERLRTVMAANSAMVLLYWDIGRMILERQDREGWGARIIDRLSSDLWVSFPEMQGLSPRNLKYMRAFAAAWPDRAIVQGTLAQITWYHNLTLLEKLSPAEDRLWYARKTVEQGWSRNILALQIQGRTATVKEYLTVRQEGSRTVKRLTETQKLEKGVTS